MYVYTCTHIYTCIYLYISICTYTYMYMYIYIHTYICMCIIYIYTHICMHRLVFTCLYCIHESRKYISFPTHSRIGAIENTFREINISHTPASEQSRLNQWSPSKCTRGYTHGDKSSPESYAVAKVHRMP